MQKRKLLVLWLAGAVVGGWMAQDKIIKYWHAYVQPPAASQTVIYRWVGKDGVAVYSSQPEHPNADKVTIDTSRITPIKPPPPRMPTVDKDGKPVLKEVREELLKQQQQIQEARMKQAMGEQ